MKTNTINFSSVSFMADVTAPVPVTTSFNDKLNAQLEKQRSTVEVIDKKIVIKDIGPVITKEGVVEENRRRIVDTNNVIHWCFVNQLSHDKLAAGMPVTISYREKTVGDKTYINVLKVTPELEKLSAQQLAFLNNNPLVIPAL